MSRVGIFIAEKLKTASWPHPSRHFGESNQISILASADLGPSRGIGTWTIIAKGWCMFLVQDKNESNSEDEKRRSFCTLGGSTIMGSTLVASSILEAEERNHRHTSSRHTRKKDVSSTRSYCNKKELSSWKVMVFQEEWNLELAVLPMEEMLCLVWYDLIFLFKEINISNCRVW